MLNVTAYLIRQLPTPLLTRQYLPSFDAINSECVPVCVHVALTYFKHTYMLPLLPVCYRLGVKDIKEQVRVLNLLILLLPDVHQAVLKVSNGASVVCLYDIVCVCLWFTPVHLNI